MNSRLYWIFALALVAAVGCHAKKAPVENNRTAVQGTVTLDGKPLPCGSITFVSAENPMFRVTAMIRPDGGFSVADAPKGLANVTVETQTANGANPNYVPIPKRYGGIKTSGLSADIKKDGTAPLSFELKSK